MPSGASTCESCSTHYLDDPDTLAPLVDSDEPEYGPPTLYQAFIDSGMTHEEILDLEERARIILLQMEISSEIEAYMKGKK
jgi:hypothetical protein